MAFKNQMPFGVPNQMNSFTPQNNEGLGVPWGQATFNISRQASSDPVANIMAQAGNPMGNMTANFSSGMGGIPGSGLKQQMTEPTGYQQHMQNIANHPFDSNQPQNFGAMSLANLSANRTPPSFGDLSVASSSNQPNRPYGLKTRMMQAQPQSWMQPNIFM